ncbi:ribonuclease H-like domain-containing protein [Tanacetum coccineum]
MSVYNSEQNSPINSNHDVTRISKLDISDPVHLHPNDTTALTVVSIKLKGTKNYQVWSYAMLLALEGKNKIGFIDVLVKDLIQMRFLVNSEIGAKHVWEELKETYDKVDGSIMFGLHNQNNTLKQNGSFIANYYHKLNALWKYYDAMIELPKCICNASEGFLIQFHVGLDDSYMQIRNSILSIETLPDVRSSYATISSEASHRVVVGSIAGFKIIGYLTDFGKKKSGQSFKKQNVSNNSVGKSSSSEMNKWPLSYLSSKTIKANQHMTYADKELDNVIDISHLRIKVGHPNGTKAYILKIRNLRLGHPAEPVMNVLKGSLQIDKKDNICEDLIRNYSSNFCVYTPQQNGIAERKHRLPSSVLNGKSPYEMIYKNVILSLIAISTLLIFQLIIEMMLSDDLVATLNEEVSTLEKNIFSEAIDALLRNGTWELVDLPEGRKAIGSKWIYMIKFRSSGEIDRYKTRLVAQGFG